MADSGVPVHEEASYSRIAANLHANANVLQINSRLTWPQLRRMYLLKSQQGRRFPGTSPAYLHEPHSRTPSEWNRLRALPVNVIGSQRGSRSLPCDPLRDRAVYQVSPSTTGVRASQT